MKVKPLVTHQIDSHGKHRVYIACKRKVSDVTTGHREHTFSHREVNCQRDHRPG